MDVMERSTLACARCATRGFDCCRRSTDDGWKIILLPGEATHISRITGKARSEFADDSPLVKTQFDWYVGKYAIDDPLWALLASLWTHPLGISGRCVFQDSGGCVLSYPDRPFICRIYPLDFNFTHGTIFKPGSSRCPVVQATASMDDIVEYFGDDIALLRQRFRVFRRGLVSLLRRVSGNDRLRDQDLSPWIRQDAFGEAQIEAIGLQDIQRRKP